MEKWKLIDWLYLWFTTGVQIRVWQEHFIRHRCTLYKHDISYMSQMDSYAAADGTTTVQKEIPETQHKWDIFLHCTVPT